MGTYAAGDFAALPSPFAPAPVAAPDATVGIDAALLALLAEEAGARDLAPSTLLDMIVREAVEG